jgi:hypothetical protein
MGKAESEIETIVSRMKNYEPTGYAAIDIGGGSFLAPGIRQLMLERGQEFERDDSKLDKDWSHIQGPAKECFKNSADAAVTNPELTYVEGYALVKDMPMPFAHAWLVDKNGLVVDPTWEDGHSYFGIKFETSQLVEHLTNVGYQIIERVWYCDQTREFLGMETREQERDKLSEK